MSISSRSISRSQSSISRRRLKMSIQASKGTTHMSNVSLEAPVSGATGRRDILARVATVLVLVAFALLAFAHVSNATEATPASAPTDAKTVEVIISNFTFTPNELTIAPGTTVKWVNQ